MMVYPNLEKAMIDKGISLAELGELIGLSLGAMSLKTQGVAEWTLTEAIVLCNRLNYSDITKLFLRLDYK